jgi:predicted porin
MKKTLIASAVAATLAGNAMAADVTSEAADLAAKLDSMPTFYGAVQFAHVSTDDSTNTDHELQDNGSTIGILHEHAISEGVTAFAKAEFEFSADDKRTSTGINKIDEAYIGLKGDFGSVQVGSDETVYDWVDMTDIDEFVGFGATVKLDEGDNLQYVSPEIAEGITLGLTAPIDSDTNFGGALAAKYSMDNLQVALAYALGRDAEPGFAAAEDTLGLGVHFDIDELTLVAQYETTKDTQDAWGLLGVYAMGQNSFALGYQMISFDASALEDQTDIYVQALHNLSDNAYLYLEYLMQTDIAGTANSDLDTLAIGAAYLF